MEIFPAIDIRDGKVVRLTQGDYDQMQVYGDSPVRMAETFMRDGAKNLHVVDLDGAKEGRLTNFSSIRELCSSTGLFIEAGGGIRDEARVAEYLELGVGRVILGTVAVQNFAFVEEMVKKYGSHIAVGVDARDGFVAVQGWLETTRVQSIAFCRQLHEAGVQTVIYTDIQKDGALQGTNLTVYRSLREIAGLHIVASGGISFEHEITALRDMGIYGAILGKALYANRLSLKRALELADYGIRKGEEAEV